MVIMNREDPPVCLGDDFSLSKKLKRRLYPYQIDGILFLWKLYKMKNGGVIADDMGLGKTIQVIAFLTGMFKMWKIKHVLIVVPPSLIQNWEKEFEEWAPWLYVFQYHGENLVRDSNLNQVQRGVGVLLTTYGLVRTAHTKLSSFHEKEFKWDYVILDEAQAIKNPTQTTKAVHKIPSMNRIALTGTPVQNNLRELWSLYDFVHRGTLLGSVRSFKMDYETPIVRAREKDALPIERELGGKLSEKLFDVIKPYFLRRTKAEVLKAKTDSEDVESRRMSCCKPKAMTRKNDFIVWLVLRPLQQKLYMDFLRLDEVKEILMTKKSPLVQLTVMKKICDHPRLLPRAACENLGFDNLNISLDMSDGAHSIVDHNLDRISSETLLKESSKIVFTLQLLTELKRTGHRCLVFSLSKQLLTILKKILLDKGFVLLVLDGTVSDLNERAKIVQKFQTNFNYDLLLLTTRVGGVGLTLTAADRVIILDPSWNPALDNQAVDRACRIGQEKNVVVYRLITCSTIEEKIYRRQIFKEGIIRQANKDSHDPIRYFTKEELHSLFQLENVNFSKTQKQLEAMQMGQRVADEELIKHIDFLRTLDIFAISDHDLMFSRDNEAGEEEGEKPGEEAEDNVKERKRLYLFGRAFDDSVETDFLKPRTELMNAAAALDSSLDSSSGSARNGLVGDYKSYREEEPLLESLPSCSGKAAGPLLVDYFSETDSEEDYNSSPKKTAPKLQSLVDYLADSEDSS